MVAIVILNYNSALDVMQCIKSIREYTHDSYSIYLVNNLSTDDSWDVLRTEYGSSTDVEMISCKENRGYSAGNNIGIHKAIGDGADYVMIANPDIIFRNDVVSNLKSSMEKDSGIGFAAPYIYNADGGNGQIFRNEYCAKRAFFERKPLSYFRRIIPGTDIDIKMDSLETEMDLDGITSGCCFMLSREAVIKMKGLDENVFMYYEEYIILNKLKRNHLKVRYVPSARVIHNHVNMKKSCSAFVNLHRYYSSLYCLKVYTKASRMELKMIYAIDLGLLLLRACTNREYKDVVGEFRTKVVRLNL